MILPTQPCAGEMSSHPHTFLTSEAELVAVALELGAESVGSLSEAESALPSSEVGVPRAVTKRIASQIREGDDPLGAAFSVLRTPEQRRPLGATYTPPEIVEAMCDWAATEGKPIRIVDPGSGSGRFALAAAQRFPKAELVAVELDPLAALLTRGNLAAAGLAGRARVVVGDYRSLQLDPVDGSTLYIGNPPYVRHHQISPEWKEWLDRTATMQGHTASKLAGLHVHFFLATASHARQGDLGSFVTSSEWLDVNYGSLVRQLLLDGLGGQSVHVLEPTAMPFADAATTAAISNFRVGEQPTSIRLRRVEKVSDLKPLTGGRPVRRERLVEAKRWSPLLRTPQKLPEGYVELGELCRVHRGTVTGANHVWIAADDTALPEAVLRASVTRAKELFSAGVQMDSADTLRRVIDLPRDLDDLHDDYREPVDEFLRWAEKQGAKKGYIARHRPSWWSVGMRAPAPILATYMARRPPAFVRNNAEAGHINIAHGLYPRQELTDHQLNALAASLRSSVTLANGRTYAGGLTKFEPREMERLSVPTPEALSAHDPATPTPVV